MTEPMEDDALAPSTRVGASTQAGPTGKVGLSGKVGASPQDGATVPGEAEPECAATDDREGTRGRAILRSWTADLAFVLIGALVVSTLIKAFVAQMFVIPSTSMTNTLLRNDRVVVSKVSDYHRGDIVVFKDPGGWLEDEHGSTRHGVGRVLEGVGLLPSTASNHLIKRLVGLPGDHVVCCDAQGRVSVNGHPLDETSYLFVDPTTGRRDQPARMPFDVVVPAGRVWLMGDHRSGSWDSRCHLQDVTQAGGPSGSNAFVPTSDIVGPASAIVAPLGRLRHFTIPATFAGVPAPGSQAPTEAVIRAGTGC